VKVILSNVWLTYCLQDNASGGLVTPNKLSANASTPQCSPSASPVPKRTIQTPESPGFAFVGLGSPSGSLTPEKVNFLMCREGHLVGIYK
jgi:hypothetical protein